MGRKRTIAITILVALMVILAGCEENRGDEMILVSQDEIIYDKANETIDFDEMMELIGEDRSFDAVCKALRISHYKIINETKYIVVKTSRGPVTVFFDSDGQYATPCTVLFSDANNEDRIKRITRGMKSEDVKNADPDGWFDYLYRNWSGFPQFSVHFFENGKAYLIRYTDLIVDEVTSFTI